MFKVCIVGHGNYPSGVCSALKLLSGNDEGIHYFDLDHQLTHEEYEKQLTLFLEENDKVLIFADMTGGAPHQIATRLIVSLEKTSQYIVSSVSLNLILDMTMKNSMQLLGVDNIELELAKSIEESKEMVMVMPESSETIENTEEIVDEGI